MRIFLLALAFFTVVSTHQATAASVRRGASSQTSRTLGLGVVLGEPTAFSGKVWMNNDRAIDFGLGYSYGNYVIVFADYLFQWPGAFRLKSGEKFFEELVPYVGVGLVMALATSNPAAGRAYFGSRTETIGLGVRIPLGIEWLPSSAPLGVFLELAPGLGFVPLTYVFFQGGIGVRYYF